MKSLKTLREWKESKTPLKEYLGKLPTRIDEELYRHIGGRPLPKETSIRTSLLYFNFHSIVVEVSKNRFAIISIK